MISVRNLKLRFDRQLYPRAYAHACTSHACPVVGRGAKISDSPCPWTKIRPENQPPSFRHLTLITMLFKWSDVITLANAFQTKVIIGLIGVYVGYLLYYGFFVCPTRHIPGPFVTRFTYARYYFLLFRGKACMETLSLHQKYGTVTPSPRGCALVRRLALIGKVRSFVLGPTS